ncbi:MAG: class I SAM-dependent methyltransferase [Patescibacteria group bacterium]
MFNVPGQFDVKSCHECGLFFLDPQPSKNVLKKHYPRQQYYSYKGKIKGLSGLIRQFRSYLIDKYYEPTILSRVFSFLVQSVPGIPKRPDKKPWRVLDVGCGSGDTLIALKKLGWEVYGLEIDRNAIKLAKKRGLTNIKLGGYEKIEDFPDNYFDCIRLYHVIEHLPNPHHCLQLIYKKLKKGGEIVLGTPNAKSMVSKIFGIHWYNLDVPRHLFVFSPDTLSRLVDKAGFSQISVSFCSGDGLGRSIIYTINGILKKEIDTNHFTFLFLLLYPLEWILDKLKIGDIIIVRGIR